LAYRWKINIKGFEGTLYEGEDFQLLFKFNNKYPFDSPEVITHFRQRKAEVDVNFVSLFSR